MFKSSKHQTPLALLHGQAAELGVLIDWESFSRVSSEGATFYVPPDGVLTHNDDDIPPLEDAGAET